MSFPSESLPPEVVTGLQDIMLMKYSIYELIVVLATLVYNHAVTLSEEIRLIWPWEWRAGKILYLLSRYAAFVDAILFLAYLFNQRLSQQQCRAIFTAASAFATIVLSVAEWTILSRTSAIWSRSKVVVIPLTIMLLGAQAIGVYLFNNFMNSLQWSISPYTFTARCYAVVPEAKLFCWVYVLIMSFEFVILVLTAWKGVTIWRTSQQSNLVKVLYRDGVIYFAILFAISTANFATCVVATSMVREFVLGQTQLVLHSICTTRIILNLRGAASERALLTTTGAPSKIHFDSVLTSDGPLGEQTFEYSMDTMATSEVEEVAARSAGDSSGFRNRGANP